MTPFNEPLSQNFSMTFELNVEIRHIKVCHFMHHIHLKFCCLQCVGQFSQIQVDSAKFFRNMSELLLKIQDPVKFWFFVHRAPVIRKRC